MRVVRGRSVEGERWRERVRRLCEVRLLLVGAGRELAMVRLMVQTVGVPVVCVSVR